MFCNRMYEAGPSGECNCFYAPDKKTMGFIAVLWASLEANREGIPSPTPQRTREYGTTNETREGKQLPNHASQATMEAQVIRRIGYLRAGSSLILSQ